jgi:uncharacterized protein YndB with AHSA1/START domain
MASRPLTVALRQRFGAKPSAVFRAFTEPALLEQWFSPDPALRLEVLEYTLRLGGRYRFRYYSTTGDSDVVAGTFCDISPPSRLAFTWTWEPPDPHAGVETLVTIELAEDGDETLVAVSHERFPDASTRKRHESGWSTTLPRLAALIS